MRVLLDANVIITFLTRREDKYLKEAIAIVQLCADGLLDGYVAIHSLSAICYTYRKYSLDIRLQWLKSICKVLRLANTSNGILNKAIENRAFKDIEDNLQDCCAQRIRADYIVTANVRDYRNGVVPAVTPVEFLAILQKGSVGGAPQPPCPSKYALPVGTALTALHGVTIQIIRLHHHHLLQLAA